MDNATTFCLCGTSTVYMCPECYSKHATKTSHADFPIDFFGLYQALGNNKDKLVERIEAVKKCNEFLQFARQREEAVLIETNTLIKNFVSCYQRWLDQRHRCFETLVEAVTEEISLLLVKPRMTLTGISQSLVERSNSLSAEEANVFCPIPGKKQLSEIMDRCSQALDRTYKLEMKEYENEVEQGLMNLLQGTQEPLRPGSNSFPLMVMPCSSPVPGRADWQKPIAVFIDQVKSFNVATNQWQQLATLHQKIQVNENTSSTWISPKLIIACGGGYPGNACTCHVGNTAYQLDEEGSVQVLPRMTTGRKSPGVAWNPDIQALYVFGGLSGSGTYYTALRSSEVLQSNRWSSLPDMNEARCDFNPCWHSSLVYLCGGLVTTSVETYNPISNCFTLMNFRLHEKDETTAVSGESGVLTIITHRYISKLQPQGTLDTERHSNYSPKSSCTPIVCGGVVYVVSLSYGYCLGFDLVSGEMRTEVKLSR